MSPELVEGLIQRPPRFAELYHARLQVVERTLDKAILLLIMRQQIMPQWVLILKLVKFIWKG